MAREYAKIRTDIWADEDWREVTGAEKLLYFMLLSHSTLSYAGVADWRPNRLAPLIDPNWGVDQVRTVAEALEARHLIVVDDETEEVLVRSFLKHDGVMKQPRLAVSMAGAFAGVASMMLRQVIAHEVRKLRDDMPELKCWTDSRIVTVLEHSGLDVKEFRKDLPKGLGGVSDAFGGNVDQSLVSPTSTSTTTSTSSKEDTAPSPRALEVLFDEAYSKWPKKVERKNALERFKTASKKLDPQQLAESIKKFGDAYEQTTERQFIPALGVWLNGERWTDELPSTEIKKPGTNNSWMDRSYA